MLIIKRRFITSKTTDPGIEYHFQEQIGEGKFGRVVKVIHKASGIARAAKVVFKNQMSNREALANEIEMLKRLDHPNIVKIIETFESEHLLIVILELCTGGDLFERIRRERTFSELQAVNIMKKLFSGVMFCHRHNICHLDLKPENCAYISQDQNSDIKILDFGLASIVTEDELLHDVKGTVSYISPDVIQRNYNSKADC